MTDLRSLVARRAVRAYTADPVPAGQVERIVDVARWTGSARNRQPWRFVAVSAAADRRALARLGAYAGHLADAPTVLVVLSPAEPGLDTELDVGRVVQSVVLAAADAGLGACVVSLYPAQNARAAADLVGAEPGWTARHAIALGHPGVAPDLGPSALPAGRLTTADLLRFRPDG